MRTLGRLTFRSINSSFWSSHFVKRLSTSANASSWDGINEKQNTTSFESADEFEHRIFGGVSGSDSRSDSFFQKLDRIQNARNGPRLRANQQNSFHMLDGDDLDDDSFDTLSDGVNEKLKKAAAYYKYDIDEILEDGYSFRPDVDFPEGTTYDIKDLDLTRPAVSKPVKPQEFEVTTEEVLRKADFRNVRFLANFITDAGVIIKRSKTGISAKAQRKVAREIKTARAFGLLPFTTMGTKSFVFGKTMESLDEDFEYETFGDGMVNENGKDPLEA